MGNFNQKEFNNFILENNVIGFFQEPITLKSGRVSHFYVNWRDVVSDVFLIDKLTDFIISFTKDLCLELNCFYGVPEGATKLGVLTQYKWAKNIKDQSIGVHSLPMGRAKPKEHGDSKDRFFVGIPKGKTIVLEDTTTTGSSLINTLENLRSAGVEVIAVIGLTNRMEKRDDGQSVKQAIELIGVPYYSMSNALDLLPKIYMKSNPGDNVKNAVEEYFKKYGVEKLRFESNNDSVIDRLLEKIDEKQTPCIVGLDPVIGKIPKHLIKGNSFKDVGNAFREFNFAIIDAIYDLIPAVKPQMAFYEKYGTEGVKAFKDTVDYAKSKGLIVIEDGKRNDIGSTAQAYADGHLGVVQTDSLSLPSLDVDLLTVNPYLGSDGIKPFIEVCKEYGKGIFILVKTSNPSSGEFQDKFLEVTEEENIELNQLGVSIDNKTQLYNIVALQVNRHAQNLKGKRGYSPIGAVVGATYPGQAETLRKIMPNSFFLVPGYGAQGGTADNVVPCFNSDGYGAVVNSSRGIIYAYQKYKTEKFAEASREATKLMIKDINSALERNGKLPLSWKKDINKFTSSNIY